LDRVQMKIIGVNTSNPIDQKLDILAYIDNKIVF